MIALVHSYRWRWICAVLDTGTNCICGANAACLSIFLEINLLLKRMGLVVMKLSGGPC